jgi:hypothetical protein
VILRLKAINPFLDFLRSFVALASSKHDGYHVGSTLQDFAHCGKFGGM